MLSLVTNFPNCLFDVITDTPFDKNEVMKYGQYDNINLVSYPYAPVTNPFYFSMFSVPLKISCMYGMYENLTRRCMAVQYDRLVCNDFESLALCVLSEISSYIPTLYITHVIRPEVKQCSEQLYELVDLLTQHSTIKTITQLENNKRFFTAREIEVVPLPITDQRFFKPYTGPREGILFIGRHEDRKQPDKFVEFVKRFPDKKVKILTSGKSKDKWINVLTASGIKNFEVRSGMVGEDKLRYIQSSELAYHPAKMETFGFAAIEEAYSCPTILSDKPWADYFVQFPNCMRMSDFNGFDQLNIFDPIKQTEDMVQLHHIPTIEKWRRNLFDRPKTDNIELAETTLNKIKNFLPFNQLDTMQIQKKWEYFYRSHTTNKTFLE